MVFLEGKERMAVAHGGYSQVAATFQLLHKAQEAGMDYCHLISGADYPCQSNKAFDAFFCRKVHPDVSEKLKAMLRERMREQG